MDFPKEVTAVNGKKRWQGANGLSYDTYEEAAEHGSYKPDDIGPYQSPELPAGPVWTGALFMLGMGLACGFGLPYYLYTGQMALDGGWRSWILPFGWFLMIGIALQGGRDVYYLATGKQVGADYDPEGVFNWWLGKVGCGILLTVGAIIALIIGWASISSLFDGVSKGTAIIIVLLFGILVTLASRR